MWIIVRPICQDDRLMDETVCLNSNAEDLFYHIDNKPHSILWF